MRSPLISWFVGEFLGGSTSQTYELADSELSAPRRARTANRRIKGKTREKPKDRRVLAKFPGLESPVPNAQFFGSSPSVTMSVTIKGNFPASAGVLSSGTMALGPATST